MNKSFDIKYEMPTLLEGCGCGGKKRPRFFPKPSKPSLPKPKPKKLYEKFVEDSDPIADMNIGMIHQIKLWMTSINEPFENKNQALSICAKKGKTDYVKYLLSAGANVHTGDDSALQWASNNGHTDVVKVLLSAGANVHADDDLALRWTSEKGHTDVVKVLLSVGANVHAKDDLALQWASENGYVEVVKVLLSAGADVHARNDNALQWANSYGHTDVVKVLKDWIVKENKVKESINEKFTEDSDPIADMNIGMIHQIKLWMKSINRSFKDKDQALIICAKEGKTDYVKYLLNTGADIHTGNDYALQYASYYGHTEVIKVLLSAGADVHANDDWALRWASENGHVEVVKVLLSAGANVHAGNDDALQWASEKGQTDVVKVLKDWIAKEKKTKVRESLNEKFTEDSDPIHDLGIGICGPHEFEDLDKFIDFTVHNVLPYLYGEIPKDVLYNLDKGKGIIPTIYFEVLTQFFHKNNYTMKYQNRIYKNFSNYSDLAPSFVRWVGKLKTKLIKMGYKTESSVNEKFIENSDPIEDMGIGKAHWFNKVAEIFANEFDDSGGDAEVYMDIAKQELEEMYLKGVSAKEAAESCLDNKKFTDEWLRRMSSSNQGEPSDDLKANCRSYQDNGSEDDADELAQYLISRHPSSDEYELKELAYDWVGIEDESDLEESYTMNPIKSKEE